MKIILRGTLLLIVLATTVITLQAHAVSPATQDQPFVVEYYYKARWGYADEFLQLFKKNHLPVLKKQVEL